MTNMPLSEREKYSAWRKAQMSLPLAELIEKSNCGFDCPDKKPFSCGCDKCGSYNFKTEKTKHLWDKITGFFRKGQGCILERKERPEACLRMVCNKYQKIAGNLRGKHGRSIK